MFNDESLSLAEQTRQALAQELNTLRAELMSAYLAEIQDHLSSLESELKKIKKFDAFGNEITPEGKDAEVWEYFALKNLWEKIFNKSFKVRQARYLDKLENFLSDTVENPERHIELFGRGLLWRYATKSPSPDSSAPLDLASDASYEYLKTDDPLVPLVKTLQAFYNQLISASATPTTSATATTLAASPSPRKSSQISRFAS